MPLQLCDGYLGDPTIVLINAEDPRLLSTRMASATWADCTWMFKSEVHKSQDRSQVGWGRFIPTFISVRQSASVRGPERVAIVYCLELRRAFDAISQFIQHDSTALRHHGRYNLENQH